MPDQDATVSSVDLPVRAQSIGHFEVLEKLGAGGMGIVYKARDTKLSRLVALKVVPAGMAADADARRRLMREARAAAQLDHPNICSVYSIDEHEGSLCIAMQYLEGCSLREEIAKGKFSPERFRSFALQLAAGLEEAHGKGIVHRDLKPANIMVLPGEKVKLVDFGLASSMGGGEMSMTGGTSGTPAYMAPEILRGYPADQRSDLFAMGVIFYEMLSGKPPFPRDSAAAAMEAILHSSPSLSELEDPGLAGLIQKMLVKDPATRLASAKELREALEGRPAPAVPAAPAAAAVASRTVASSRSSIAMMGGVAALCVGLAVWGFNAFGRNRPPVSTAGAPPAVASASASASAAAASPAAAASTKISVAALPFTFAQKDPKWTQFEQGIADAFADAFLRDARFRVVERSQLDKALEELRLDRSGAVDPATAARVGKIVGARYLIVGSFQVFEGQMRLNARMIRVETGEIAQAQTLTGPAADALKLTDRAAQEFLRSVKTE